VSQQQPESLVLPPAARSRASVLGLRDFRLLWAGQTISAIGDQIFPIAVALKVVHASGSAGDLGLVLLGRSLAMVLFLVIGGVYADRVSRTRVMIGSDAFRAIAVLGLAMAPAHVPIAVLTLMTFVVGGGEAFFRPAYGAILPSVVPGERLAQANAYTSVSMKTSLILGPALGGSLVALTGPGGALLVDALTFVVSILTLLRIAEPPRPSRDARTSPMHEALEGVAAVRERPWIGAVLVMATLQLMLCIAPMIVLEPFIARERLGGDWAYGALLVVFAAGGLAGAIPAGRFTPRLRGQWALLGLLPHVAFLVGLAYSHSFAVVAALAFVAGVGLEPFQIWWASAIQQDVPEELLARVISLDWLVSLGLLPLGLALAGPAAAAFGRETVLLVAAGTMLVTTLAILPVPGVREFRSVAGSARLRPREVPVGP
jgi:DHA3 family tetracycline resistance protein-like MFS transporter